MNHKNFNILAMLLLFFAVACSSGPTKMTEPVEEAKPFTEKYRPQFHFSPDSAWMNDPNGMVYFDGEYHLFYQYYPDSTVWGPMHWGHAISTDLVHWQHMPIALYPDSLGFIFSGSAVVDWNNTTGFGSAENPPLVAIFTYHDPKIVETGGVDVESQAIAYSLDKGRSWTKYEGNPVIPNDGNRDFRDPNVIWNEEIQQWNLVLSAHDHVQIYTSDDLKSWKHESDFGIDAGTHDGVWECPDLFPLQVEGTEETKWVLIVNINPGGPNGGSGTQYFLGDFDGHEFTADSKETKWVDWGRDNYAGVTWSDVPKEDGRRIFLGWMSNWAYANVVPTDEWRSAMTLPRKLSLVKKNDQYVLKSTPVKETELITDNSTTVNIDEALKISGVKELDTQELTLNQSRLSLEFEMGEMLPESFGILLENELGENVTLSYSASAEQFQFDRTQSGDMSFSDKFSGISVAPYKIGTTVKLEIFVDAASAEVFVDGGDLVMTEIFFNSQPFSKLKVFAEGQPLTLTNAKFANINSIW
ncbi:glycoside hydrolase family 32 protein [uncultured Draconibacterium sp.]|uniref:glycoside hydrolase family 32 protein n=1 Tax=uncultured Draconibacterium sp. TaxID=1573823 RepID=UPI002AA67BBE|nr:glycoside hydrolase family 32 protein [uncultured Draconibacterium sp.]